MEISKQTYLINQQIFATACYPSDFSYLNMGMDIIFTIFVMRRAFHNFIMGCQIVL